MSCYYNPPTVADVCLGMQDHSLIFEYPAKFLYKDGVKSLV